MIFLSNNFACHRAIVLTATVVGLVLPSWGCSQTFHQKFEWHAENFFDDAKVVELCRAIEADDLNTIERLLKAGANVNAIGKGNMTPLLWAFPDDHLLAFETLLKNGADPNVEIDDNVIPPTAAFYPKDSVTQMVCRSSKSKYFELVFDNGGDPNLPGWFGDPPLIAVIKHGPCKKERIKKLIEVGADIDKKDNSGTTPVMTAVVYGGQYDIAIFLLELGADFTIHRKVARLVHDVVGEKARVEQSSSARRDQYRELVEWLESNGESIKEAEVDSKRWDVWIEKYEPKETKKLFDQEVADRLAREEN